MNVACALLAAGSASRFGSNKLLHPVDGIAMIERAFRLHASLPYRERLIVTRRDYAAVIGLAERYEFRVLFNDAPERGMGSSAAVAAEALLRTDAPGALFAVSDQPWLRAASVGRLLRDFAARPNRIVSASFEGRRGNPCVFPRSLFAELAALDGERGGGAVIARHMDILTLTEVEDALELTDVDAP